MLDLVHSCADVYDLSPNSPHFRSLLISNDRPVFFHAALFFLNGDIFPYVRPICACDAPMSSSHYLSNLCQGFCTL
ncbi:hypothetical protein, partial [Acinetobacter baumannii]|uniref:hypothetical protein n=1 Tax=Acinetobacter baumannii TaxID=470 RepID=UPI001C07A6DC